MENSNIKVSIIMPTYNHEKYIEQAICSVLEQNVDFIYELLIGEDCSTDNTGMIVDRYYNMYPQIIKVVRPNKNIGAARNAAGLRCRCKGQYVIMLEGDDYWINRDKLKRQAEFLDNHPEYIGVTHNVKTVGDRGEKLPYRLEGFHWEKEHIYTKKNALNLEIVGHTSGLMYRNIWKSIPKQEVNMIERCKVNGDQKISIILGLKGDIYYFEDTWSVYRRRFKGNSWSAKFRCENMYLFYYENNVRLKKLLEECYGVTINIDEKLLDNIDNAFLLWRRNPSCENRKIFTAMMRKKGLQKRVILKHIIKCQWKR